MTTLKTAAKEATSRPEAEFKNASTFMLTAFSNL